MGCDAMLEAEEKFTLTRSGYEHIQRELEALEAAEIEEREDLSEALNDSVQMDDDADVGAEFEVRTRKERKDEQIAHLHYILDRAEINDDPDPSRVNAGARVTLWDFGDKRAIQLDVLSTAEVTTQANVGPGVRDVSDDSPVGQAIIGKAVGDVVEVDVPDGKVRYAIRKIEVIPEATGK